jgi:tetratricopeptide (TPR) repeat protein
MKIKNFVILSLFIALASTSFAQNSNLRKAASNIQKYDELRMAGTPQLGKNYLEDAKTAIDEAIAHDKTKDLADTWTYYSLIYGNLATDEKSQEYADLAAQGIAKAKELDKDGKNADNIAVAVQMLGAYNFNTGVGQWESQNYQGAYDAFNKALEYMPGDTTLTYYSGLAAIQNKQYEKGIAKYKELIDKTDFSSHRIVMVDLPKLYLSMQDTAAALEYAEKAMLAYPEDRDAVVQNIELNLIAGNNEKIVANIQQQLEKDSQNKNLYYYLGLAESGANHPDKALEAYRKAIEIDPNYADANLNAGVVLMNQVRDLLNDLNNQELTAGEQSARIKELKENLKPVEAYFSKVLEVEPNNSSALRGLKNYYDFSENEEKSKEISERLENL